MRISVTISAALATLYPTQAESLYEPPTGAIFSNANTAAQWSPKTVMSFLLDCASSTSEAMVDLPDDIDCLFDNFIVQQFTGPIFGDVCSPHDIEVEDINAKLQVANALCTSDFTSFIDTAVEEVSQLFEANSCWQRLCDDDREEDRNVVWQIESNYLETCSEVELPYPYEDGDDFNIVLTCMLEHIMNNPASEFDLEQPPVKCYPPGYDNMDAICLESLARPAYDACTSRSRALSEEGHGEAWLPFSAALVTSMSMSMPTGDDDDDGNNEGIALERFCSILEGLTTGEGLECLDEICTGDITMSPSSMPSASPSATPKLSPSAAPSSSPTAYTESSGAVSLASASALVLLAVPLLFG